MHSAEIARIAEPPTTKPSTAPAPTNPTSSVKKSSDFLGTWLVMDRRGRHEREPASHDAADATNLDVSLSNAAACPDLETRKSLVTSTNSDIFNVAQRATAVFDEFDHHGTLREPPACVRRAELGEVRDSWAASAYCVAGAAAHSPGATPRSHSGVSSTRMTDPSRARAMRCPARKTTRS
jgi:hypothetical protein